MLFKKLFRLLKRAVKGRAKRKKITRRKPVSKRAVKKIKRIKRSRKPLKFRAKRPQKKARRKASKIHRKKAVRHVSQRARNKPQIKAIFVGAVLHFFPKVNAAVVKLKKPLRVGEPVWIKGNVTDFKQTVVSMQIDRKPIDLARAGQEIGLEVMSQAREGDKLFILRNN